MSEELTVALKTLGGLAAAIVVIWFLFSSTQVKKVQFRILVKEKIKLCLMQNPKLLAREVNQCLSDDHDLRDLSDGFVISCLKEMVKEGDVREAEEITLRGDGVSNPLKYSLIRKN